MQRLPADLRAPGLRAFLYALPDTPSAIPDTASLAADAFAVLPAIDFPSTADPWPGLSDSSTFGLSDSFALSAHGFLDIPASGVYTLRLTSDDGSRLWLDGAVAIDNDGAHSMTARTASVPLSRGLHPLRIDYFEASGDAGLVLEWTPPGAAGFVPVPAANLCHDTSENLPPQLRLAPPARPCVVGESVPLLAGAWDFDGAVARVDFLVGTNAPVSVLPDASGLFALDLLLDETAPPSLPVVAIAYDEAGAASAPAAAALEVWTLPAGFALGLAAEYHPLAANPGALPDFAALTNGVPAIESQLAYASSTNPWPAFCRSADGPSAVSGGVGGSPAEPGLFNSSTLQPADFGCFAAEIRGALLVTEPGRHELVLSSDDGSRLWLDGELVIDNDGDHSMRGLSASRVFAPGLHPLRVEYYNGWQDAGLVLSWTPPSATGSAPIPPHHLYHAVGPLDADGDGLPDWWEAAHGLAPSDLGDALLDPDADGLTCLAEFLAGTDPNNPDTDNDGIPDAWEIAHNLCPFVASDALLDPDLDGLTNLDEFRAGSDPHLADTDGDGIDDMTEVRSSRTDPTGADILGSAPIVIGDPISGSSVMSTTGRWDSEDGVLFAHERAGSATWLLDVPGNPAPDAIVFSVSQHNALHPAAVRFDLSLEIDGLPTARLSVRAVPGSTSNAVFFLPPLDAGPHSFRLVWRNRETNVFLAVHSFRFVCYTGPDANGNGVEDWREARADATSLLLDPPLGSSTSPLCLEGGALWRDIVSVATTTLGGETADYAVNQGVGDGFWTDIPLPEDGSPLSVSLSDGIRDASFAVEWTPFDIPAEAEAATNGPVRLREGDSLRLAGFSGVENTVTILRPGSEGVWTAVTNWTASIPAPFRFDAPGIWRVEVTAETNDIPAFAAMEFVAVRSRFASRDPAVVRGTPRPWPCPSLDPGSALEHDEALDISAETMPSGGLLLTLDAHSDEPLGLVSRLDSDGPVLDAVRVRPLWADNGCYYRVVENYADGSQLAEVVLQLGHVPADLSVRLEIFVSGVMFPDGSRVRVLTAADFDADGRCSILFLRAAGVSTSVCHYTTFLQNGDTIGSF